MKKVLVILICILGITTTAFGSQQDEISVQNQSLMSSKNLFNMMKNSIETEPLNRTQSTPVLDELEQEKYDSLLHVNDLTEENRIVLAKMMAFRYREAQKISENILSTSEINFPSDTNLILPQSTGYETSLRVAAYYIDNKRVAIRLYDDYMEILTNPWIQNAPLAALAMRDQQFISYVKSGGPWDLKSPLGTNNSYKLIGFTRTGEYIGNHHFGYMGRHAGYAESYLKVGAGFYQVASGTSSWSFIKTYFDDPRDQEAISRGYSDYLIDIGGDIIE